MKEEALPKSTFAWNGNHRLKHVKCMFPFHARRKGRTWNNHRPHSTLCGTFAFHANFIFLPLAWPHTARLGKEVGRELVRAEVWARRGRCRRRSRYIQHISRGAGRSEWPEMAFCAPDPTSDPRVRSGKRPQKAVGAPSPSGFKYLGRGGRKEGKVWKVGKTGREGGRKEGRRKGRRGKREGDVPPTAREWVALSANFERRDAVRRAARENAMVPGSNEVRIFRRIAKNPDSFDSPSLSLRRPLLSIGELLRTEG